MADTATPDISGLVEELSGSSRRRRQEVAHTIALAARANPAVVAPHADALIDALFRPEAQTRWEVLDALGCIAQDNADLVAGAFDGAEASLFDDGSATVRLAASAMGSNSTPDMGALLSATSPMRPKTP